MYGKRPLLSLILMFAIGISNATAGLLGWPLNIQSKIQKIRFEAPTLAPMAYTMFCLKYADECYPQNTDLNVGEVRLNQLTLTELAEINTEINAAIIPQRNEGGLSNETWSLHPKAGDCNDYAVTKKHELMKLGWPSDALLLAEVMRRNEHHLVLVVRTNQGDLVLDNLTDKIKHWSEAPYRWVRIQSPIGSQVWAKLSK